MFVKKTFFIIFCFIENFLTIIDDNTWFGGNLKLNKTDVLKDIDRKPLAQYEAIKESNRQLRRTKSSVWPHVSEYEHRFAINSTTDELE
jgi:hypothetical protein